MLIYTNILLLLLLLLLSAFFSGAETALFSLSTARLLEYKNNITYKPFQYISKLMQKYNKTLIVLISGNMFVNVGLSMVSDEIVNSLHISQIGKLIISGVGSIILLLVIGEITPKIIALAFPEKLSEKIALPLYYFSLIISPAVFCINVFLSFLLDLMGRKKSKPLSQKEYYSYLNIAGNTGTLSQKEINLLRNALTLREKTVSKVMMQRTNILTINKNDDYKTIKNLIKKTQQKYFPIVENDIDDANEMILSKRFLSIPKAEQKNWVHTDIIQKVCFIPENTILTKGLATMKNKKMKVALVTDEYGGIQGIIDLEDIYEELVGEIEDEYDTPDWNIKEIKDNEWFINGSIPLFMLENLLKIKIIENNNNHTLNGLFSEKLGRISTLGDSLQINNILITVTKSKNNMVSQFKVVKK